MLYQMSYYPLDFGCKSTQIIWIGGFYFSAGVGRVVVYGCKSGRYAAELFVRGQLQMLSFSRKEMFSWTVDSMIWSKFMSGVWWKATRMGCM